MELTFQSLCIGSLGLIGIFVLYAMLTGSASLRSFIVMRVLLTIPMIWVLVTVVFLFMRVLPGDPIKSRMKPGTDPVRIAEIRDRLGLNDPLHVQYVNYLKGLIHGDFGVSIVGEERPVAEKIQERLPATIELVIPASLITLIFGVASGAFAADKHKKTPDVAIRLGAVFIYSIPIFWMGLLLQLIFSLQLGWLPVAGRIDPKVKMIRHTNILTLDSIVTNHSETVLAMLLLLFGLLVLKVWINLSKPHLMRIENGTQIRQGLFSQFTDFLFLGSMPPNLVKRLGYERFAKRVFRIQMVCVLAILLILSLTLSPNWGALKSILEHMILPVTTLSLALVGVFVRLTRSNMIETLQEEYVSSARARGVPERKIVYYHSLRNTFIPILTLIGLQVAILFAGAVLTETTFSWPGMGLMLKEGIALRDYPLVQGGVTVFAVMISVTTLLMDILYAFVDPRIRY